MQLKKSSEPRRLGTPPMVDPARDVFTLMLEPVKACNIRCTYCYSDLSNGALMSIDTVKTAVEKAIAYASHKGAGQLHIIWHGGEPLLAGLNFFKEAQAAIFGQKLSIPVTQFLQTNGLLLDEKFCRFFSTQNIQVGISLDGPKEIHDAIRITRQGEGTHDAVINKLKLCRQNGLAVGLCMVVTPDCLGRERQIFQFFNELGLPFRANPVLPAFAAPRAQFCHRGTTVISCAGFLMNGLKASPVPF